MTKILHVVKPFFVMDAGDTFELSENGTYVSTYTDEYSACNGDDEMNSSFTSTYEISESYAKSLVDDGYLAEEKSQENSDFVNVFDEIEKLSKLYIDELSKIDEEFSTQPTCLKVEKETVLNNLLKVLDHLHSLKK